MRRSCGVTSDRAEAGFGLNVTGRAAPAGAPNSSGSAKIGPISPAAINAPETPQVAAANSIPAGANALPTYPANVWIENARPTRASPITPDVSIA